MPYTKSEKLESKQPRFKSIASVVSILVLFIVFLFCAYPIIRLYFEQGPAVLAGLKEIAIPSSSNSAQHYALDSINHHPLGNKEIVINSGKETDFIFAGWAVDPQDNSVEGAVFGLIDEKYVIPTKYGLCRRDVSPYLHPPTAINCGYEGSCSLELFSNGKHTLSLAIVQPDKVHYYRLNNLIHFKVE